MRKRVNGEKQDGAPTYDTWSLQEVLNLRKERSNFADEASLVSSAPYPFYESRNVQGE